MEENNVIFNHLKPEIKQKLLKVKHYLDGKGLQLQNEIIRGTGINKPSMKKLRDDIRFGRGNYFELVDVFHTKTTDGKFNFWSDELDAETKKLVILPRVTRINLLKIKNYLAKVGMASQRELTRETNVDHKVMKKYRGLNHSSNLFNHLNIKIKEYDHTYIYYIGHEVKNLDYLALNFVTRRNLVAIKDYLKEKKLATNEELITNLGINRKALLNYRDYKDKYLDHINVEFKEDKNRILYWIKNIFPEIIPLNVIAPQTRKNLLKIKEFLLKEDIASQNDIMIATGIHRGILQRYRGNDDYPNYFNSIDASYKEIGNRIIFWIGELSDDELEEYVFKAKPGAEFEKPYYQEAIEGRLGNVLIDELEISPFIFSPYAFELLIEISKAIINSIKNKNRTNFTFEKILEEVNKSNLVREYVTLLRTLNVINENDYLEFKEFKEYLIKLEIFQKTDKNKTELTDKWLEKLNQASMKYNNDFNWRDIELNQIPYINFSRYWHQFQLELFEDSISNEHCMSESSLLKNGILLYHGLPLIQLLNNLPSNTKINERIKNYKFFLNELLPQFINYLNNEIFTENQTNINFMSYLNEKKVIEVYYTGNNTDKDNLDILIFFLGIFYSNNNGMLIYNKNEPIITFIKSFLGEITGITLQTRELETIGLLFKLTNKNLFFKVWNSLLQENYVSSTLKLVSELIYPRFDDLEPFDEKLGILLLFGQEIKLIAKKSGFNYKKIEEILKNSGMNLGLSVLRGIQDVNTTNLAIEDKLLQNTSEFFKLIKKHPIQLDKYKFDGFSRVYNLLPWQSARMVGNSNADIMLGPNKYNLQRIFNRVIDGNLKNFYSNNKIIKLNIQQQQDIEFLKQFILNLINMFRQIFGKSTGERYYKELRHNKLNSGFNILTSSIINYRTNQSFNLFENVIQSLNNRTTQDQRQFLFFVMEKIGFKKKLSPLTFEPILELSTINEKLNIFFDKLINFFNDLDHNIINILDKSGNNGQF